MHLVDTAVIFSKTLSVGTVYKCVSCISSIKSWSEHYIPSSRPIATWTVGRNGREGKDTKKAKGQRELFPSILLHPVLDATRTITLFLALAASFSKSQCFSLFYIPPVKLKADVLIHQTVLEGYHIGGWELAVDLPFNWIPQRYFLDDFWKGGAWDSDDGLLDPSLCFSVNFFSSVFLHDCTWSSIRMS